MILETVKIEHEKRGWVIINKSDFDPKTMKLYGVEEAPKRSRKSKEEEK